MSINTSSVREQKFTEKGEAELAQIEAPCCQLKATTPETPMPLALIDDEFKQEQRDILKKDLHGAARHAGSIESKPSKKQKEHLLNVLANPSASESEWMRAVHILGDYQHKPAVSNKKKAATLVLLIGLTAAASLIYCGYENRCFPGFSKPAPIAQAADIDYTPYLANMQRRIKRLWFPPRADDSSSAVLRWKVYKDGRVGNLKVYTTSGEEVFDQKAMAAVENAAPFPPLPQGSTDDVDIEFTFDYNGLDSK